MAQELGAAGQAPGPAVRRPAGLFLTISSGSDLGRRWMQTGRGGARNSFRQQDRGLRKRNKFRVPKGASRLRPPDPRNWGETASSTTHDPFLSHRGQKWVVRRGQGLASLIGQARGEIRKSDAAFFNPRSESSQFAVNSLSFSREILHTLGVASPFYRHVWIGPSLWSWFWEFQSAWPRG